MRSLGEADLLLDSGGRAGGIKMAASRPLPFTLSYTFSRVGGEPRAGPGRGAQGELGASPRLGSTSLSLSSRGE